jgi:purine-binding chemotaxis protein CheW
MEAQRHLIVCAIDDQRIGLPLTSVDRIVRAVAVTPLAGAPDCVLGVVNFGGQILPVIDLRKQYGLPSRGIELSDELVIAVTAWRKVALLVDSTEFVVCPAESLTPVSEIVAGVPLIQNVVKQDQGLILLHNIHLILSNEQEHVLKQALESAQSLPSEGSAA